MNDQKPILMNDQMVRAILAGGKNQTRRPIKRRMNPVSSRFYIDDEGVLLRERGSSAWNTGERSPFGIEGTTLYVREAFAEDVEMGEEFGGKAVYADVIYRADWADPGVFKWRPSIHMPKRLARIWLYVERVWVEMLQEISVTDAISEGCVSRESFQALWDSIYGDDPLACWEANPLVWVCSFTVLAGNEEA